MPYINHQMPTPYWNRHPDWYNGAFKDLCHAWGVQAELAYYASMEKECAEVAGWFAFDFLGALQWLKKFFMDMKVNAYAKNYLQIYDENALGGCKFAEGFEGKLNQAFQSIKDTYNQAKADAQAMVQKVSDYIQTSVTPAVQKAQQAADQITSYVNGAIRNTVNDAFNQASAAQQQAQTALNNIKNDVTPAINQAKSDVAGIKTSVSNLSVTVNNSISPAIDKAKTDITKAQSDLKNAVATLNQVVENANRVTGTINSHTTQISELYAKIGQKTPVSSNEQSTDPLEKVAAFIKGL